jgi:hypothetical protein
LIDVTSLYRSSISNHYYHRYFFYHHHHKYSSNDDDNDNDNDDDDDDDDDYEAIVSLVCPIIFPLSSDINEGRKLISTYSSPPFPPSLPLQKQNQNHDGNLDEMRCFVSILYFSLKILQEEEEEDKKKIRRR